MANDFIGNPYMIDTAEDKTITAKIHRMVWEPATADNDLMVKDGEGNELWKIRADTGGSNAEDYTLQYSKDFDRWVNGINIATIDGGTLKIYVR